MLSVQCHNVCVVGSQKPNQMHTDLQMCSSTDEQA